MKLGCLFLLGFRTFWRGSETEFLVAVWALTLVASILKLDYLPIFDFRTLKLSELSAVLCVSLSFEPYCVVKLDGLFLLGFRGLETEAVLFVFLLFFLRFWRRKRTSVVRFS